MTNIQNAYAVGVEIPPQGIYWDIIPMIVDDGNEKVIELQWGWTAGMSPEELANYAEDAPAGYDSVRTTWELAERLRDKLTELIDILKNEPIVKTAAQLENERLGQEIHEMLMADPELSLRLKKPEEFFENAEPCNAVEDVKKEQENKQGLIDETLQRELQAWDELGSKVV